MLRYFWPYTHLTSTPNTWVFGVWEKAYWVTVILFWLLTIKQMYPATMGSIEQHALQPQDMLQNRSCGCINSSTLKFTNHLVSWICLYGHTPTFYWQKSAHTQFVGHVENVFWKDNEPLENKSMRQLEGKIIILEFTEHWIVDTWQWEGI